MRKLSEKVLIGLGLFAFFGLAALALVDTFVNDRGASLTTYFGEKISGENIIKSIKVVREKANKINDALFDVVVTIPDKSKELKKGENLVFSVELVNFGTPDKTEVDINYIITDSDGNVVLIEHESRIVEKQSSFVKQIKLPNLSYGKYKIFVELLYSDTSATASADFNVITF